MSAADRPWWATDDADPPGDEDPLDAHRAARRGARGTAHDDDAATDGPADRADDGSWWVPATEAVTRLARDLAAAAASPPHGLVDGGRAGAAGEHRGEDGDGAGSSRRPAGDGGDGGDGAGHRIDACGVCPICVGLRALGDARPELVGHLAEAARQLALAVRTVVDAGAPTDDAAAPSDASEDADAPRRSRPRRPGADELRRIELDD